MMRSPPIDAGVALRQATPDRQKQAGDQVEGQCQELGNVGDFLLPGGSEFRFIGLLPMARREILDADRVALHRADKPKAPLHAAVVEHQAGCRYTHRRAVRAFIDQQFAVGD